MRNALIVIALGALAWFAYTRAGGPSTANAPLPASAEQASGLLSTEADSQFSCDGRTHCSQMTSCAEAEFFLRNCPGVEMDGNNDGEPCESQWCGDSR
jgi:hypothetical protein